MQRLIRVALVVGVLIALRPHVVSAQQPANPERWGTVSAQLAKAEQGIGEHASGQDEPRLGLGNLARLLYEPGLTAGPHISDTATFLARIDEFPESQCP